MVRTITVAAFIAERLQAMANCDVRITALPDGDTEQAAHWTEWRTRHRDAIERTIRTYLPSGSGFDAGTTIDYSRSRPNYLVFRTSFHHMDPGGAYDGWSDHWVGVSPAFDGISLHVSGRDRDGIKDYIHDAFYNCLTISADYSTFGARAGT